MTLLRKVNQYRNSVPQLDHTAKLYQDWLARCELLALPAGADQDGAVGRMQIGDRDLPSLGYDLDMSSADVVTRAGQGHQPGRAGAGALGGRRSPDQHGPVD